MAAMNLLVNGKRHTVEVEPSTPLLYVLRNDLDLAGPRFGCGLGQCGACTVLIRGEAVRSCVRPVSQAQNVEITTLEGLAKDGQLHPIQQAWIDEQVPACGFCQNGQILTAKALLDKTPNPTDAQIRDGMKNTLCRCMTYYRDQCGGEAGRAEDGVNRQDARRRAAANSSSSPDCSSRRSPRSRSKASKRSCSEPPAGTVSRSRFPAARLVDRDSS